MSTEKPSYSIKYTGTVIFLHNIKPEAKFPLSQDFRDPDGPRAPNVRYKPAVITVDHDYGDKPTWDNCLFRLYADRGFSNQFWVERIYSDQTDLERAVQETCEQMNIDISIVEPKKSELTDQSGWEEDFEPLMRN